MAAIHGESCGSLVLKPGQGETGMSTSGKQVTEKESLPQRVRFKLAHKFSPQIAVRQRGHASKVPHHGKN